MRSTNLLIASFIALACTWETNALPNGAPKCIVNPPVITKGHKVQGSTDPATLGMTVTTSSPTYTPGQAMQIMINSDSKWQGVLMYVAQGAAHDFGADANADTNRPNHVGQFTIDQGYRAQSAGACNTANVVNDAPESTITQADATTKNTPGTPTTFTWTAPAQDVGPVTVTCVVSVGTTRTPYAILQQVTLMPAGGAAAAPAANVAPTVAAANAAPTVGAGAAAGGAGAGNAAAANGAAAQNGAKQAAKKQKAAKTQATPTTKAAKAKKNAKTQATPTTKAAKAKNAQTQATPTAGATAAAGTAQPVTSATPLPINPAMDPALAAGFATAMQVQAAQAAITSAAPTNAPTTAAAKKKKQKQAKARALRGRRNLAALDAIKAEIQADVQKVKDEVAAAEAAIEAEVQADIAKLKGQRRNRRLAALDAIKAEIQADVQKVKDEVAAAEAAIEAEVQADIAKLKGQRRNRRLAALDAIKAEIQADVQKVKDEVAAAEAEVQADIAKIKDQPVLQGNRKLALADVKAEIEADIQKVKAEVQADLAKLQGQ